MNLKKTIKTIKRMKKENQIKNKNDANHEGCLALFGGELEWFGHVFDFWLLAFWLLAFGHLAFCLNVPLISGLMSASPCIGVMCKMFCFGHLVSGLLAIWLLASPFLNEPAWDPV